MPADGQRSASSPAGRQRSMPACEQMSQEQLLRWVMQNKFACIDANLYLDTHPEDTEAIEYFQEHNRFYLEALDIYSRTYGPLTIAHAHHNDNYWDWVNQPWPWQ
jgi:spore coat protein JB